MRPPGEIRPTRPPTAESKGVPSARRDRAALLLALATVVCVIGAFVLGKGTQFLMPGPLTSAHSAIENCNACHTQNGKGKLTWIRGLVAGDPHADSTACLTCHKMPDTAFKPHSASAEVLKESTARLLKIARQIPAPQSARAQRMTFPVDHGLTHDLACATCHQEHQGVNFKLNRISNEQCRSCHVVKFDSFDGHHPQFEDYPFRRRTRVIYDHAGHFGKHFPEMAKKNPAIHIPATCSTCHSSSKDRRLMAVAPFEQTCTSCHLDQIIGKERVSGPKGIAFLSVPGLDLQTLKKKKAAIGEWPDGSEAELTPFMKVMISRNQRGRALIKTVSSLNLQDLSRASEPQIRAVTALVWEIKGLFYSLISGKASDVLGDLNLGGGAKLSANLVADLTATIPRDVVTSAQQQWLPNLGAEMAGRQDARDAGRQDGSGKEQAGWSATITEPKLVGSAAPQVQPGADASQAAPKPDAQAPGDDTDQVRASKETLAKTSSSKATETAEKQIRSEAGQAAPSAEAASKGLPNLQACVVSVFGQCLVFKGPEAENRPSKLGGPPGQPERPHQAAPRESQQVAQAGAQPPARAADQNDDLLFPTVEELGAMKAAKSPLQAAQPDIGIGKADAANVRPSSSAPSKTEAISPGAVSEGSGATPAKPQAGVTAVISIKSEVDPESWAEYGGWYRQDYAIFYRPAGHKDKFIYSWLFLTGPQAPKGDKGAAAAVFDALTASDAQGSCIKCHSVDNIPGKGRLVNFSPPSVESKQGRFTNFVHEPHLSMLENRGCLTCHNLERGRPYLKSYEQTDPLRFASNFGAVKKELCQTCHTSSMARQDCLLCHKYHVNGVVTPIMSTKIPMQ